MCRQYSDGAGADDGNDEYAIVDQQSKRYDPRMAMLPEMVDESTILSVCNENALAGPIPTQIGQLVQLEQLGLENNQLTGSCASKLA